MKRFETLKKPLEHHKMSLQLFAEPGDEGNTPPPIEGSEGGEGGESNPPAKTFTQAEVDAIVADRLKREQKKAQQAKPNEGGENKEGPAVNVEDTEEYKSLSTEVSQVKAENAALKAGVPAENLDKVMKLTMILEEKDIDKAITAVLEEFPFLKEGVNEPPQKVITGSQAKAGGGSDVSDREIALRKRMGLA